MSQAQSEGGSAARTLSFTPPAADALPLHLREHVLRLRQILLVISVSVMALHRQNAELDLDIASVLDQHACEPLDSEIECLEGLIATLSCRPGRKGACA